MKWIALKTKEMRGYNRNKKRMETKAEERKGSEIKKKRSWPAAMGYFLVCVKKWSFQIYFVSQEAIV